MLDAIFPAASTGSARRSAGRNSSPTRASCWPATLAAHLGLRELVDAHRDYSPFRWDQPLNEEVFPWMLSLRMFARLSLCWGISFLMWWWHPTPRSR